MTGSGLHAGARDSGYRAGARCRGPWREQAGLVETATHRLETAATGAARSGFAALARFAGYCGTGAQVTHGFGATKVTLLHSDWSRVAAPDARQPGPWQAT